MSKLKKQKETLEKNIKWEEDMIKNNKTYKGADGKTYGPEHYKKAVKYDREELNKVNSKLAQNKKVEQLKARAASVAAERIGTATANRDAGIEKQQTRRYKNAPASNSDLEVKDGILSKGIFTSGSKAAEAKSKKKRLY